MTTRPAAFDHLGPWLARAIVAIALAVGCSDPDGSTTAGGADTPEAPDDTPEPPDTSHDATTDAAGDTQSGVLSCTGEPNGRPCHHPLACVTTAVCQSEQCVPDMGDIPVPDGVCESLGCDGDTLLAKPRPEGESCQGADLCIATATCDGAGNCVGLPTDIAADCQAVDEALDALVNEGKTPPSCVRSVACNPANGRCEPNGWSGEGAWCERAFTTDAAGIPKIPVTELNLCNTGTCGPATSQGAPAGATECTAGPAVVCPPINDGCKVGECDPDTGTCFNYKPIAEGEKCNDKSACTTQDRCDIKGACIGIPFDDGLPEGDCAKKSCSTIAGKPVYGLANESKACTPADPCLLTGTCSQGTCIASPKVCDDFDPCTEDQCEPGVGCQYDPVDLGDGAVEVLCDGKDDDCDGQTDEDFTTTTPDGATVKGLGQPCGTGACANGATVCTETGVGCSTAGSATAEVCNGLDDDCDGLTDALDPSLNAEPCEKSAGVCLGTSKALALCQGGVWAPCSGPEYGDDYAESGESACDELDNDCDGETDEDYSYVSPGGILSALGGACGDGSCAGGVTICAADGSAAVCSSDGGLADEICDGLDNDCDGSTDVADSSLVLPGCELSGGVCGQRVKAPTACVAGKWQACDADDYGAEWQVNVELACDGQDNDCDGSTDEDFTLVNPDATLVQGAGQPCGLGACAGGVTACADGGATLACSTFALAGAEVCNSQDDDCDGVVDADDPSLVIIPCENVAGVCAGAVRPAASCSGGSWAPCADAVYSTAGMQQGAETSCDGKDNDCDGKTDEDFSTTLPDGTVVSGVGTPCGTGLCTGGVLLCAADAVSAVCTTASAAASEVCNGADDDCDGLVDAADDNLVRVPCEKQDGLCAGTLKPSALCTGGSWAVCSSDVYAAQVPGYGATKEPLCDGEDDDCDGAVDEDFTLPMPNGATVVGAGKSCGTGACAGGVTACGADSESLVCPTSASLATEVCNGIDDDCDGKTDGEDDTLVRPACENESGVCAGALKPATLCVAAQWQPCTAATYLSHDPRYRSAGEVKCDGLDEDCSGDADEDYAYTGGQVTVTGEGKACGVGACKGGVTYCNPAGTALLCTGDAGSTFEICDGKDNDCDGNIDEGAEPELCANQTGVCAGTVKPVALCQNGGWLDCDVEVYGDEAGYEADLESSCDALDNDCDGLTDEDFSVTTLNGTVVTGVGLACGVGVCAGGFTVCAGGGSAICSTSANATQEVCDGVDNDCDGLTDANDPTLITTVACEKTFGECAGVTKPPALCENGVWAACTPETYSAVSGSVESGVEVTCDGKDNDCDGGTDEDFVLTTLPGTVVAGVGKACGVGPCAGGVTECNVTRTATICPTEANAADTEIWYDGTDQRCDGGTDHDQDGDGVNAPSYPGGADCDDTNATIGAGSPELRDGIDNDCDGFCDEGFIAAGSLVISEFMPNPGIPTDLNGEWFEVYNPGTVPVSMCSGWTLSDNAASHVVASTVVVPAKGYAVFTARADSAVNGGIESDYAYNYVLQLSNSSDNITLRFNDGSGPVTVDVVTYATGSGWLVSNGISTQLKPDQLTSTANDTASNWCAASAAPTYGTTDQGTPGAETICP
ncbi:MAG: lamin tail domain-containing protein [Myxococcales bacterium]|nr:lamin tail domain-containing protein [Myxococcales bacterium]